MMCAPGLKKEVPKFQVY